MENSETNELSPKKSAFFFSHFFMFIILVIVAIIVLVSVTAGKVSAGPFRSNDDDFDFSSVPYYISQLSDIHLANGYPEVREHIRDVFQYVNDIIKPDLLVITGDITDATNTSNFFEKRSQYRESWDEYHHLLDETGLFRTRIIEIPGNHDLYNIESEDSPSNYYPQYVHYDFSSIHVQSTTVDNKYNFIQVNPVKFPYSSAPIGMLPYTSTDIVNEIEKQFKDNYINIILNHYPHFMTWTAHPSKMEEVYSRAHFFLTGHIHPSSSQLIHYGDVVEAITPASKYSDYSGVLTCEKGAYIYHPIKITQELPFILITYPVPLEQVSPVQIFNKNQFPIRALGFSNDNLELEVYIDDNLIGRLSFAQSIKENVGLYSLNVEVPNGKHSLRIEGDCHYKMTFFVGNESPTISEQSQNFFSPRFVFGVVPTIAFLILLRFIPFWKCCQGKLDDYYNFMYYGDGDIKWYQQLYLGPLYMICRLRKVPLYVYFVLLFLFLWYLPFPFYFAKIESKTSALWFWGYVADDNAFQFNILLWILMLYYLIFLFPMIDLCSIIYEHHRFFAVHIVEFVLFSISIIAGIIIWIIVTVVAGGAFSVFTSILFYIAVLSYIFVIVLLILSRRKNKISGSAEPPY